MARLITAVADIEGPLDPAALFPFKVGTDIVTDVAGAAQGIADDQFPAGILFPAVVSADTEVIRVIKAAPVSGINDTVSKDLFRDRGWILTEVFCDITERAMVVKGFLNKLPVLQSKMFMVPRYEIRHNRPPLPPLGNRKEDTEKRCGYQYVCEGVNLSCERLSST